MFEPHEQLTEVHLRLHDSRGQYVKTVSIPRPAIWPKAVEHAGQIYLWQSGDEYLRTMPLKVT